MTNTTPTNMTAADWEALVGCLVTFLVETTLDHASHYTGTLTTLRPGVGEVVLEDVTMTRLTGAAAGTVHHVARRIVPLVKVHNVTSLGVPA